MGPSEAAFQDVRDIRLNYIITQVDISRMARNASRHLDVKSILSLPTIVYQEPQQQQGKEEDDDDNDDDVQSYDSWSWQIIQQPITTNNMSTANKNQKEENDTNKTQQQQQHNKRSNTNYDSTTCVICLESFKQGDILRVLPCKHLF